MSMEDFNIVSTVHNMNGDVLMAKVKGHIEECIEVMLELTFNVEEEREEVAENIEYLLMELYLNQEITQGKVVFDKRNNTRDDVENHKYTIEVTYKEWNCLNFTSVKYVVSPKEDGEIEFLTY